MQGLDSTGGRGSVFRSSARAPGVWSRVSAFRRILHLFRRPQRLGSPLHRARLLKQSCAFQLLGGDQTTPSALTPYLLECDAKPFFFPKWSTQVTSPPELPQCLPGLLTGVISNLPKGLVIPGLERLHTKSGVVGF